jgi:hypothetical protein
MYFYTQKRGALCEKYSIESAMLREIRCKFHQLNYSDNANFDSHNLGRNFMKSNSSSLHRVKFSLAALLAVLAFGASAAESKVTLTGAEETPAVTTAATGSGIITVNADKSVSGSVTTQGLVGTAAHVHVGAPGKKGPPAITLEKAGDGVWKVPAGSTFTDEQYASYQAGNLYINVHSADNKGGEIRGQLKP